MKKISLFILAIALTITSCKNYDDDFKDLNKSIAELQAQVAGFSAVQANIVALQASMASLTTAVASIPKTQVDITGLTTGLAAANASITALQAQLAAIVANYATTGDVAATTAAIDILADEITLIQGDIAEILASNNVYDGDLSIANDAQLAFAVSLGDKVGIINGTLTVNATGLSAAEVSAVTAKILTVTGLASITAVEELDFSKLTSVGGAYTVTGFDVNDAALTSVGGAVTLNYDGGYTQPNLVSAASLAVTDFVTTGTTIVGTLAVDFSGLTVTTPVAVGTPTTFSSATSVKLMTSYFNIVAPKALTVDMLAANYKTGLTVSAEKAGSVVTIAGRVDNGATTPVGQALSVTGYATSVLNAAAVTKTSTLTVNGIETALSFPALTTATVVSAPATVSFSAPLLVAGSSVGAAAAKTVSLASTPTLTAAVVETLTFSALASPYTAAATLKTATVTGKVGSTNGFTSTTGTLVSATFAGELDAVSITGTGSATTDKLTTVTTNGAIGAFTLDNSDVITSISLGHSYIVGSTGSSLTITNNAKLASLTTSTNYLLNLVVTGNAKLAAMNFASYSNVISSGAMTIAINGNKLSGDYSDAVAVTGTTPYVQTIITSADLLTLKPFIAAYKAAIAGTSPASTATLTMAVNMWNVDPAATAGNEVTLSTAMAADTNHLPVWATSPVTGLTTVAEFLLIQ